MSCDAYPDNVTTKRLTVKPKLRFQGRDAPIDLRLLVYTWRKDKKKTHSLMVASHVVEKNRTEDTPVED